MNPSTVLTRADPLADRLAATDVAVLYGGRSSEREVSLHTGRAILAALRAPRAGGERPAPRSVTAIEIESNGEWRVDGGSARATSAVHALATLPADTLFFLALHGGEGENGTLQGLLAASGRRHTGAGVAASALCMQKHATRLVLAAAGLRTADATLVDAEAWDAERGRALAELQRIGRDGWYVKPNAGGSSVTTFCVERACDVELARAIEAVLSTGDSALVEARVRGTEATCAVLGNRGDELRALTPVEIVPQAGKFFDYEQKYSADGAREFCPPRSLAPATVERLGELGRRAHRATGCDGYSRTDFIVPRAADGADQEPVVLEVNTLPGMTSRSLLPQAAAEAGISFRELCLEILALALARAAGTQPGTRA
jgi:D-alanine-D-alanine ligase